MAWRGGHWAFLLAITSVAGAIADTLLPAVAGHTVDVVLRAAVTSAPASIRACVFPTSHVEGQCGGVSSPARQNGSEAKQARSRPARALVIAAIRWKRGPGSA